MVKVLLVPLFTATAPEGEIEPCGPAETVIVYDDVTVAAAWLTENVWPPTLMFAVLVLEVLFDATE